MAVTDPPSAAPASSSSLQLAFITYMPVYRDSDRLYVHVATGRVLDALAPYYRRVWLCAPVALQPPAASANPALEAYNVEVIAQPMYESTLQALLHPARIIRAYWQVCSRADHVFVRGFCPYIEALYACAAIRRRPVTHWLIGNPVGLLRSHRRAGRVKDLLSLLYALKDRAATKAGRALAGGALVCNGLELGRVFASSRTVVAASSTVRDSEFFIRSDTCQGSVIHLLFVGYIRPEKGIEYLLEALAKLRLSRPWDLTIVGPEQQFSDYRARLERLIVQLGLGARVHWAGYVPFGPALFAHMRRADILVLPSLSEGTPHVLVESRANSLPAVATNVGGIPTTVRHEHDALLVPPKDADSIARAVERLVEDSLLRRRIIANGLASARLLTVDRFAALVRTSFQGRHHVEDR